MLDQGVESRREHVAGDAQASLKVVEAPDADEGIAQDQQRPPLAHDLEGLGDGTVHVLERATFHATILPAGSMTERNSVASKDLLPYGRSYEETN